MRRASSPIRGEPCMQERLRRRPLEPLAAAEGALPSPDRAPSHGSLHPNPPPSAREEGGVRPLPPGGRGIQGEGDATRSRCSREPFSTLEREALHHLESLAGKHARVWGRQNPRGPQANPCHRRTGRPAVAPSTPTLLPRRGRREGLPLPPGGRGIQGEGGWCLPMRAFGLRPWLGVWPRARAGLLFARTNTVGAADGTAPQPHPPPRPSSLGEGGGRACPSRLAGGGFRGRAAGASRGGHPV